MNSQRPPQILRGWISDMTESAIQTKYSTLHTDAAGTKADTDSTAQVARLGLI